MLSALELLDRIVAAPEPERGVCRKCGRPAATNLLWLCEGCADALHAERRLPAQPDPAGVDGEPLFATALARALEAGEHMAWTGIPPGYGLPVDAGKRSWERVASAFPEALLETAEAYAAKLDQDDKEALPF